MKKRKYKGVIFDLDGTLLNTLEDLMDSVNYGLKKYGMPERSLEEIRRFVGNGAQRLVSLAVVEGTPTAEQEKILAAFQERYAVHCNDKTDLYPGIRELLRELKKREFPMAIVSNKPQRGVDALHRIYFQDCLSTAIGARDGIRRKPSPDRVYEGLRCLGLKKEEAVFVGDSEVDIATARAAEMDCITVSWGFRTREEQEKAGAVVFVDRPEEIISLLYF